jgi:DivIVA domain-containing protein
MVNADRGTPRPRPGQLSAEQVRRVRFDRTGLGRRGVSEDEVYGFLHRVAEELAARDAANTALFEENRRLKEAMRDWQARHSGPQPAGTERVSADAIAMMSRAQEQIDAQLAQADLVARQTVLRAQEQYEQIVAEARGRAHHEADRVAHQYRASAGTSYNPDQEQIRRQQVYLQALLQALDAVAAHLNATRQVFAVEVQNLAGTPVFPAGNASISHPLQRE